MELKETVSPIQIGPTWGTENRNSGAGHSGLYLVAVDRSQSSGRECRLVGHGEPLDGLGYCLLFSNRAESRKHIESLGFCLVSF